MWQLFQILRPCGGHDDFRPLNQDRSYLAPSQINFRGRKTSRCPHGLKIWNSGHIYLNSYILLNSHTHECFTFTDLTRSIWLHRCTDAWPVRVCVCDCGMSHIRRSHVTNVTCERVIWLHPDPDAWSVCVYVRARVHTRACVSVGASMWVCKCVSVWVCECVCVSHRWISLMGWLQLVGSINYRSLLPKRPIKETIFCKRDLWFYRSYWP